MRLDVACPVRKPCCSPGKRGMMWRQRKLDESGRYLESTIDRSW